MFNDLLEAISRALRVLSADKKRFKLAVLLCILGGGVELIGVGTLYPFLSLLAKPELIQTNSILQHLFEWGGFRSANHFLIFLGWSTLFFFLGASLFLFVKNVYITRFCLAQTARVSVRMLEAYLRKPMLFHVSSNSGILTKDVIVQSDQFTFGVLLSVMVIFADGAVLTVLIGLILWANFKVGLFVTLILGGMLGLALVLTRDKMQVLGTRNDESSSARFAFCVAALQSIKEIKSTGKESFFSSLFRVYAEKQARCYADLSIIQSTAPALMQSVAAAAVIGMALYYLTIGADPTVVVPTLILYVVAGYRIMPSVGKLAGALSQLRQFQPAIANISKVLFEYEANLTTESTRNESTIHCIEIEMIGVGFAYPGSSRTAVENLNLAVAGNSLTCIVGASGSGKTTIVDVLLGLLPPVGGRILINGKSAQDVGEQGWRAMFGYVPQSVYIIDGTIAENIAFGVDPDGIDWERLNLVVTQCHLEDFVNARAEGLQAQVGENGSKLSGGQRQRLGIARALYRDPPILILDESTNSLDGISEQSILHTLLELKQSKAVICIAHRGSLVKNCDRIILIDHGKVVADGNYEQLTGSSPQFAALMSEIEEREE